MLETSRDSKYSSRLRPGNPEVGRLGLPWTAHPLKDQYSHEYSQIQLWHAHIPLPYNWAD